MSSTLLVTEVARHAAEKPAAVAFEWLEGDREEPVRRMTYAELHRQGEAASRALVARILPGERVLLAFPPGLEFIVAFVGCLGAGVLAVPVPFPQNRRTLARTRAILRDCKPALVLTSEAWLGSLRERLAPDSADRECVTCVALEELLAEDDNARQLPIIEPAQVAYLQYTSGSGGVAKGVMVTHANLAHNVAALQAAAGFPPSSLPLLSWLPHYHDMQLAVMLARTMLLGARCVLMSPLDFLQRPVRWLRALSRSGAYFSGGPNFAYEHCLRRIPEKELEGLDLSRWRIAFNSSEHVRLKTLEHFAQWAGRAGFTRDAWCPAYGLAEATAYVTGFAESPRCRPSPESGRPTVSCGWAALDDVVLIVRPADGSLCRAGEIGEICVAGAAVTCGYWNRPEATAQLFHRGFAGASGPCLRTGDLGFVDEENRLYVTGRLKDLIVIRGINHHPEDIEASVDGCNPALIRGELAAFSVEDESEAREQLVIAAELVRTARRGPDVVVIAETIQAALSREHELALDHLVLLLPGALPKTTSGKMQRGVCRRMFVDNAFDAVAHWRRTEARTNMLSPAPRQS